MDHDSTPNDATESPIGSWRELTTRQRIGLGMAASIVLLGLSWNFAFNSQGELVPLSTAEPVTTATARKLRTRFRDAGLTNFQISGDQILVPKSQLDRYAAVLPSASDSDNWASEWERQNAQLTPFSSSRAREATREIARAKLIANMLRQLPDIEQADVVWDEEEQPGWRQSPRTRATIYLRPKSGRVLTLDVVRSVRHAVAGSKKNLDPTDVVVMDLARQLTYEGELPHSIGENLLPSLQSLAEVYRREITRHVPQLDDAEVTVRVDWPRFLDFIADHPNDASANLTSQARNLLTVHVLIPANHSLVGSDIDKTTTSLTEKIAALTGMRATQQDRNQSIQIEFEPAATHVSRADSTSVAGMTWATFDARYATSAVAFVMIGIAILLMHRRRSQVMEEPISAAIPTLQDINKASRNHGHRQDIHDFDDIALLNPQHIRSVYAHATPRRWAVALRGSVIETRDEILAALDSLDADELQRQCNQLGPVTIGDIESSRQRILESAFPIHASSV